MEAGASRISADENCKIIFRHSIRGKIESGAGREVLLTNEGIELCRDFGRNLKYDIGFVGSSSCKRNIQTCKEILSGNGIEKEIVLAPNELERPQIKDRELSNKAFEEANFRSDNVLFRMNNEDLPGFNSVEVATKIIIDFIFANGNKENTVDLFCTHDFQMAILYSCFFGFGKTKESIEQNKWPMMLEGMILWGTRNHFWCSWRNEIKEFVNF